MEMQEEWIGRGVHRNGKGKESEEGGENDWYVKEILKKLLKQITSESK